MITKKSNKKKITIIVVTTAIILVTLVVTSIWLYKTATVNQLRTVAYQFKPESGWKKLYEFSNDPAVFICIKDNPCPMYEIDWSFSQPVTKKMLQDKITAAGWSTTLEGSCEISPNIRGRGSVCRTEFKYNKNTITIWYERDPADLTYNSITLIVHD